VHILGIFNKQFLHNLYSLKYFLFIIFWSFLSNICAGQSIIIEDIKIYRDGYGVPYIYTKTDAQAAYALAWVQCEDNFQDVQETLLAVNSLLAQDKGKDGALLDAAAFIVDAYGVVEEKYEDSFSEEFKKIIKAYADGMNAYASHNPDQVRNQYLLPITEYDVIAGYILNMFFISNNYFDLGRIFENDLASLDKNKVPSGSNGIAVSPNYTSNGNTYLVCNSHQPLEGFASWYEVQINTEEGWHFHGATFAAGITPFIGTNENLGWTHTVNYDDFTDVYKLKMVDGEKLKYHFDDQILTLKKKKFKTKVKIGPFKIPVAKTFYEGIHGMVIKNKEGYFSVRFPSNMVIGQAEQWYRMNKSNNFDEFRAALDMQQIASLNLVYADKDENIFYLGNGLFPKKNPKYDYSNVLPGEYSDALWEEEFLPIDSLLSILNPKCGYIFNANNTSFDCTCSEEDPSMEDFPEWMGYQKGRTARSIRFQSLFEKYQSIDYADLKDIKYDSKMEFPLYTRNIGNLDVIRNLDERQFPHIRDVILKLQNWNGETDIQNQEVTILSLAIQHLLKYMAKNHISEINTDLPEEVFVEALEFAQKHLMKHFGTLNVALGDLQKHVRNGIELPIGGIPEAIATLYTVPYKDGLYKSYLGDSYILFASYDKDGLAKIETSNCFGSSNRKDSPHHTDQMEMHINKELKEVKFDALGKDVSLKGPYSPERIKF